MNMKEYFSKISESELKTMVSEMFELFDTGVLVSDGLCREIIQEISDMLKVSITEARIIFDKMLFEETARRFLQQD